MNAAKADNFPNTEAPVRPLLAAWLKFRTWSAFTLRRRRRRMWVALRWPPPSLTQGGTSEAPHAAETPPPNVSHCLKIIAHVFNSSCCVKSLQRREKSHLGETKPENSASMSEAF